MTTQQKQESLLTMAYNEYGKALKARAFYKLHNKAVSEDIVQITFLKAWNYLDKGGKIDTMKAFLYRILNNLIIDEYRRHKASSLDTLLEKGFEPSVNPSEEMFYISDGEKAFSLIERLPQKYQNVIQMRHVKDLSLSEMSALTGQSKNTIAVQIHRGLEKLKWLHTHSQQFESYV